MTWESFKQKHNVMNIRVGNRILKLKYRKYDRQRSMNYILFRKPYAKFLFNLEEYARFDWFNDAYKFHRRKPLRDFNLVRKSRGWLMVDPINWKRDW